MKKKKRRKKKSWFRKHLGVLSIALILIVAFTIIIWGLSSGWISMNIFNQINKDTEYLLKNPPVSTVTCSLSISPKTITEGSLIRGTLNNGINTYCEVYAYMEGDNIWRKIWEGTTDFSGQVTQTENLWVTGTFHFRAVCDINNNGVFDNKDCVTNEEIIKVNSAQVESRCIDSDGNDIFTFGWVDDTEAFVSYPDECYNANSVIEYVCNPMPSAMMPQDCPTTHKCEGGKCVLKTYNVGDVVFDSGNLGFDFFAGTIGMSYPFLLNLPPTSELGNCKLQARISTDWGYITPSTCLGLQGNEGLKFEFYDSSGKVWERIDTSPIGLGSLTKCGLVWDGHTGWSLQANKLLNLPQCSIGLDYKVDVIICEC